MTHPRPAIQADLRRIAARWGFPFLLLVAVLVCYGQTINFDFVTYDDQIFLHDNKEVWKGLNADSIAWAFSLKTPTGWNPLAWVTHIIDCTYFGLWAGGHHFVNVALHAANVLLLFSLLLRWSLSRGVAFVVAMLLAIHPLHVESIAWVAERRDVLSLFFALLTLHAYTTYTRAPSWLRYLPVVLLYALALMSKPMMVTLPCAMLLVDAWPLNRLKLDNRATWFRPALEKMPLLLMALAACWLTFVIQSRISAVVGITHLPLGQRLANATVAYAVYLVQLVKPDRLTAIYPLRIWEPWRIALAAAMLVAISVLVFRRRRNMPWLLFGWLWYLGTLVPVIGLVQVGAQAHADRYTYLPAIGIYLAVVMTIAALASRHAVRTTHLAVPAAVIFLVLGFLCFLQVGYWRDPIVLFAHALDVTTSNHVAENNLGTVLRARGWPGDRDAAREHFIRAIELQPGYTLAKINLARILIDEKRPLEAIQHLQEAAPFHDNEPMIYVDMARALRLKGDLEGAIKFLGGAFDIDPKFEPALRLLADLKREQAAAPSDGPRQDTNTP